MNKTQPIVIDGFVVFIGIFASRPTDKNGCYGFRQIIK